MPTLTPSFRTNKQWRSQYGGKGERVPLLDSKKKNKNKNKNAKKREKIGKFFHFAPPPRQVGLATLHSDFELVKSDPEIVKFDTENMSAGSPLIISQNDTAKMVKRKVIIGFLVIIYYKRIL